MQRRYTFLGSLTVTAVLFLMVPQAHAQGTNQFNNFIQELHASRVQVEAQMGLDPQFNIYPQASSYYDDLVDHYEHDQLMMDTIDEGLLP